MGGQHEETIRRATDLLNQGDVERWLEFQHPGLEIHTPRGVLRGHEGARQFAAKRLDGELVRTDLIEEVRESGDEVVMLVRRVARWRETDDAADEVEGAVWLTMRDRLILRAEPFSDRGKALRAAGIASA